MKFYHGGHIGDVIYSLYTIMKVGGGELVLGPGQQGGWGKREINALLPLCEYQRYITKASLSDVHIDDADHDFTSVGAIHNPEEFFEWHGERWPGNAHLKKRYFNSYFRKHESLVDQLYRYNHEELWIESPLESGYDVIFHAPFRKLNDCRSQDEWLNILQKIHENGFSTLVIGGEDDIKEWPVTDFYDRLNPIGRSDFLSIASHINNCKLFMGAASCNYVIAEGLNKLRFVDMAPQTEGAEPKNERGWCINSWSADRVIKSALMLLRRTMLK